MKRAALAFLLPMLAALVLSRNWSELGDVADQAIDKRLNLYADTGAHNGPPIVFVDFDDLTMARLGHPPLIPPEATAEVVRRASQFQPSVILIDIDLTWIRDEAQLADIDDALRGAAESGAIVLLSRTRMPNARDARRDTYVAPPLDSLLRRSPHLAWVSAEVIPSGDGVVRAMPPVVWGAPRGRTHSFAFTAIADPDAGGKQQTWRVRA